MGVLLNLTLFLGALAGMEGVAWWTHRYLMHGSLWMLHRSHHEPRTGVFELNDLFAVFFSLPSMVLIYIGTWIWGPALYLGLGMTAYGAIYALFHDGLVPSPLPLAHTAADDEEPGAGPPAAPRGRHEGGRGLLRLSLGAPRCAS